MLRNSLSRKEIVAQGGVALSGGLTTLRFGLLAGAGGGLAEIAWVSLYAGLTGQDPALVARAVTTAAGAAAVWPAATATLGVLVHMLLAAALGVALAFAWRGVRARFGADSPYPFALAVLTCVWAINFFVVLPITSPAFIGLLPYGVSLASKLLFGAAVAEALRRQARLELKPRTVRVVSHRV